VPTALVSTAKCYPARQKTAGWANLCRASGAWWGAKKAGCQQSHEPSSPASRFQLRASRSPQARSLALAPSDMTCWVGARCVRLQPRAAKGRAGPVNTFGTQTSRLRRAPTEGSGEKANTKAKATATLRPAPFAHGAKRAALSISTAQTKFKGRPTGPSHTRL